MHEIGRESEKIEEPNTVQVTARIKVIPTYLLLSE